MTHVPFRRGATLFALAVALGAPGAVAQNVEIRAPAAGHVVVSTSTATILMQVFNTGLVAIPGLSTAPQTTNVLCFDTATGTLGPCAAASIPQGPQGLQGIQGIQGVQGNQGPPGIQGPPGPVSGGTIIPFASGLPIVLQLDDGEPMFAAVAFGSSLSPIVQPNPGFPLDMTFASMAMAFSMPRNGVLTDMTAFMSTTVATSGTGPPVNVTAQLYCSATPDNLFTPFAPAVVLSPALVGFVTYPGGTRMSGTLGGLSVPLTVGTRCMMVFGLTGVTELIVVGHAGGGIAIQ